MTECLSNEMRDALPDLIHGSLDRATRARVEAHLASCAQCAAELEILRSVISSSPTAPPVDVKRIVAALPVAAKNGFLLHRGNGDPAAAPPVRRPQSVWSRPALRIAAAVALVAAGGLSLLVGREVLNPEVQVGRTTARVARASAPIGASTSPAPAAPAVAQRIAPSSQQEPATAIGAGLLMSEVQQLSDEHLVALLSEMDDMDAIPLSEPETIAPAFAELDTSGASQ
jgi:anti-sigma factor RsiW